MQTVYLDNGNIFSYFNGFLKSMVYQTKLKDIIKTLLQRKNSSLYIEIPDYKFFFGLL